MVLDPKFLETPKVEGTGTAMCADDAVALA
jgi:hypothetical protein